MPARGAGAAARRAIAVLAAAAACSPTPSRPAALVHDPLADPAARSAPTADRVARAVVAPAAGVDSATPVIRFTQTVAERRRVWTGDTLVLEAPAPPAGTPPGIAADLRWSSLEPAVATIDGDGRVVALSAGEGAVRAWRLVGETVVPIDVLPSVRGRVVDPLGAPLRARVIVRDGASVDTVATTADGRFLHRPARRLGASASVRVEPLDTMHAPALVADLGPPTFAPLDVVLLPARWGVAGRPGVTVPISPAIAQWRIGDGRRFWNLASRDGRARAGPAVGWAPERLPLRVAFDRAASIGVGDSLAFWRVARQLEGDWGAPLFVPVTAAGPDRDPRDAGAADVLVTIEPALRMAAVTTSSWSGDGDVVEAGIAFQSRSLLAAPAIVVHELLHALGIGHASDRWASVMHPTSAADSGRATAEDIAYGQLLYAVRASTRPAAGRRAVGIAEAVAASVTPP